MLEQGKFLTADWRYLALLNYEIDPGVLLPYVPPGTELDSWGNITLVSMVGFLFLNTRVFGVPIPFHTNFEEVNLRFYVRRQSPDGYRRGVVFIKEIVPKIAIAKIARAIYNENYIAIPMRHSVQQPDSEAETSLLVEYGWRFNESWNSLRVEVQGQAQPIPADSEEEFITEHYWGYSLQKDNGCVEYQVEHPRWRVWRVNDCALECDVAALYGQPFVKYLQATPSSAFLAEGSSVLVRRGARLSTGIDDHE
jgi:uncharacterized protein YqjF (DUF2071 family)